MAEKYGTIPKKFTSEWWKYVWEYYKWYIIVPIAVIIAVVLTVAHKITAPVYDMNLLYAGTGYFTEEQSGALCDALGGYIDDIDGKGKSVFFSQLNFMDSEAAFESDAAYDNKLLLEFTDSDTMIMLVDDARLEMLTQSDTYEGTLMPVSEWAQKMPDSAYLYGDSETAYAVRLSDSALMRDCGITDDNIYVVVRRDFTGKDEAMINIGQAKLAANALIG